METIWTYKYNNNNKNNNNDNNNKQSNFDSIKKIEEYWDTEINKFISDYNIKDDQKKYFNK